MPQEARWVPPDCTLGASGTMGATRGAMGAPRSTLGVHQSPCVAGGATTTMLQQVQQHHVWVAGGATTPMLQQVQQCFELSVRQQPEELTEGVNNNNVNNHNIKRVA